ncbi:putative Xaa-Pro aminopeptidase Fra1p [Diutina catenulata]
MASEKTPLLPQEPTRAASCPSLRQVFSCLHRSPSFATISADDGLGSDYESEGDSDEEDYLQVTLPRLELQPVEISAGKKLRQLREQMREHEIGVYIVPSEDEHMSESPGLSEQRRGYISGFTGSAGVAIITLDDCDDLTGRAALSTDGRYFLQAEKQLDPKHWKLLKQGTAGVVSWQQWAIGAVQKACFSSVSVDPRCLSLSLGDYFEKMARLYSFKWNPLTTNLVDKIWKSRPPRSESPIYSYPLEYSGEPHQQKLVRVRGSMQEATHLVVSALDEIAWLFNLRGDDIECNPVFFAYALITKKDAFLYVDPKKVPKEVEASLEQVTLKHYSEFYTDLAGLKSTLAEPGAHIILPNKTQCNYALVQLLPTSFAKQTVVYKSIVSNLKLAKNPTELKNTRLAHLKDSLVFILFASWLTSKLGKGKRITEWDAARKIYAIRSKMPHFKGLSYETIAGSGPNGAIIHYAPTKEEHSVIDPNGVFLLDSGAQYLEGTTDITRTYKFNHRRLSKDYKRYYTLVLQGHLAVATARFPPHQVDTGTQLDAFARRPLWNAGLDYKHGTGHGVASFGPVHESPLSIGANSEPVFRPGGVVSDEPGYYIDGEVGFRIESELEVYELDASAGKTRTGENFLGFRYLTRVPFCRKLIDVSLLSPDERDWINNYHADILHEFGPRLRKMGEKRALHWLRQECRKI